MIQLKVMRVSETAILPAYQSEGAAGLDLHLDMARFEGSGWRYGNGNILLHDEWVKLPTGIAVEIPEGFEGQVRGRSSMAAQGWAFYVGTIDSDYRGEVFVLCKPTRAKPVEPNQRIAQLVIAPVARCKVVEVAELSSTRRGTGGFGSTNP